jgi:hypothetical protein
MDVELAREHEALATAGATLTQLRKTMEEKLKTAEAETRRRAFDEFLGDVRVEERHYLREAKSLSGVRKCLVVQERVYFRNIPLTGWVEHEMAVEAAEAERPLPRHLAEISMRAATNNRNVP